MAYRILSHGYDFILMPLRSTLLREAGYEVVESYSWKESVGLLGTGAFDLLLICHTVPPDLGEALIEVIQPLRPRIKVLSLQPESVRSGIRDCPDSDSDSPQLLLDVSKAMQEFIKAA